MEPLEHTIAQFIEDHRLFAGAKRILLAISGGVDSMALLHVIQTLASQRILNADLLIAHINHQLRGAASDADEVLVVQEATKLGLPVMTTRVDVEAYSRSHKLSTETAGRQARLISLGELAREHRCAWIATGHQMNDNAETLLQRLGRGTGYRGLAGIRPSRSLDDGITLGRPLLGCQRSDIAAYLTNRKLAWREDATNTDSVHTRNHIRHRLLPALQGSSAGSLVQTLAALAASTTKLMERVEQCAERASSQYVSAVDGGVAISVEALAATPEIIAIELIRRQLVAMGCGERNLTRRHYKAILDLARCQGTVTLPAGFQASRESDDIVLRTGSSEIPSLPPSTAAKLDLPGAIEYGPYRIEAQILERTALEANCIKANPNPFTAYLDLDRLRLPLFVRPRLPGDRFHPLGMSSEKKVGKFLTAGRVPEKQRRRLMIFADAERIVWVCPVRISERVRIIDDTRRVLILRITDSAT